MLTFSFSLPPYLFQPLPPSILFFSHLLCFLFPLPFLHAALPAATAAPCSACPCCSRPVLSASSPKPSAVPRMSRPKNVRPVPLRLLPPLLVEQNQTLCDSHQVLLVCRAAGESPEPFGTPNLSAICLTPHLHIFTFSCTCQGALWPYM